ncbi:long-chain fatty acid--CoA ligase [Rhodococcus erythropolis]|uniref:AMP-dependent synthetase/ligase n=1 Tax=Rhodococcus erythropolis TaxID=1833 RepID=UPI00294A1ED6|nr:long-chain fatty acid--CoA ligase [Rhodococcus erythropolis]MDV6211966.1 long-chain fatty acid--CoA ligase [Rhodococcus erythropolis]
MSTTAHVITPAETAAPGISATTLAAAFQATVADRGDRLALHAFGEHKDLTWNQYAAAVEEVATGLADLGVSRGDTVAIMLPNSPEFHIVDMAVLHLGAVPFSIYLTSAPDQINFLFENAENKIVVTNSEFLDVLERTAPTHVHTVVVADSNPDANVQSLRHASVVSLADLRTRRPLDFDFKSRWNSVESTDLATLIYTSGTTGDPKGVELTHANLMFVMHTCNLRFPFVVEGAAISYLPTAHAADRVFSHYLSTVTGWPVTTVRDTTQVFGAVAEARPVWFLGVPRIWEKLRAGLLGRFDALPAEQRDATRVAVEAATRKVQHEQTTGRTAPDHLDEQAIDVDQQIFAALRAQLGFDRVELLMTGAAPIASAVHEFFLALGLPLQEGFGMSETGALGFTNVPDDIRVGKVGLAQPGTEAKLADDGELLLRGPHVMRGYRKAPERTAEAIDSEGWLHTGDIAVIDDDGWVSIVDRKKELIINASGKNMSPVNIEGKLKSASPLIGQACVVGDRRPYNVALIVLDPDAAAVFARAHGLDGSTIPELIEDSRLQTAISDALAEANSHLSRIEQVKAYRILDAEWMPDSDELTPTMKLKRRVVADKYSSVIDEIYRMSAR